MSYTHYERLSALDTTFLEIESAQVHMHVGAVGIFDATPLLAADGVLDMDRIRATSEAALRRSPRLRQRLEHVPVLGDAVWVDDDRFNLSYHVRHTSLPRPGGVRLLKRLVGRLMSQKLDRGKPLWEMWFVEGLGENKIAVITKMHHCMIDGIAGVDLLAALIRVEKDAGVEHAAPWIPRPAPSGSRLLLDDAWRRASLPVEAYRVVRDAVAAPGEQLGLLRDTLIGLSETVATGVTSASPTPLNTDIGPHRRFDWTRCDLDAVKEVKRRLGGTVNDVVLTIVAGAMRRFLKGRGERVEDLNFRALVPVSVRTESQRGTLGNRVSFLVARLPLEERDPRRRLARVIEETGRLKSSKQVLGAEVLEQISDRTVTTLFVQYVRLAAASRVFNMVVTNVPGPQVPVYLLGARMLEIYPLAPLFAGQALAVALFSYDGGLFWGFNADWDAVPDLHDAVTAVEHELELLRKAATEAAG